MAVSEPNDAELAWVRGHVVATVDFAAQFGLTESQPSVDELDALWATWLEGAARGRS